ncbi:hypothetical protein WJX82_004053 [Trebouxia sp. C0006]
MATPLYPPISQRLYPTLAITSISAGLALSAIFFVYEVTKTKYTRKLAQEAVLAGVSSVLLGFGTLFLLLWTGVYV